MDFVQRLGEWVGLYGKHRYLTNPWAAQRLLPRGIVNGAANQTINFIGGLFNLKNPAAGQPRTRVTARWVRFEDGGNIGFTVSTVIPWD